MIQVEKDKKIYEIPEAPGIYKIDDTNIVYGGCFYVAHDGARALYFPGSSPKTDLGGITSSRLWQVSVQIINNKVKVGR